MNKDLKHFADDIFSINPHVANMFVGLSGLSGGGNSYDSSAMETLNNLRKSTATFVNIASQDQSKAELPALADEIEGYILNLQLVGKISEAFGTNLIDQLHDLKSGAFS